MARLLTVTKLRLYPLINRVMATAGSISGDGKNFNRLASEKSPYLLQHATNPVDWYPWGEEAFVKARTENKPIFLSVGYSTCHWCHVMERESFENQKVADILSEHFVSIKVDREERPDVDRVYMTYIQATQGGGGWPMSVFLTPDLKPFIGGTYFPPNDTFGRPGFITVLEAIQKQWLKDNESIKQQMDKVMNALQKAVNIQPENLQIPGSGCIQRAAELLDHRFDPQYGGFGESPKFPQPVILDFLLRVFNRYPMSQMGDRALENTLRTLRAMANGGIHDHVGQGFHRYSTDKFWHVPHFEKMLYDQAQLACLYLDAYQISKEKVFEDVARDILLYVSRDLTDTDGGFYSAEDADSYPSQEDTHKREGAFCVWTWDEVYELLPDPIGEGGGKTLADLFAYHYDMKKEGNVNEEQDPHGELKHKNVLIIRKSVKQVSEEFGLQENEVTTYLTKAKEILYSHRQKRPKPHRDDKILTSWNGLMISGFARAAQVLGDKSYLEKAEKAAMFIKKHLFKTETCTLLRNAYRDTKGELSVSSIEGFTDDYAFLIKSLIDLYEASYSPEWLEWALHLQEKQDQLFWDKEETGGGYFSASGRDSNILLKIKEDQDGSEPSPNSVSVMNLLRFSSFLNKPIFRSQAEKIFKTFNEHLTDHPAALSGMVSGFMTYLQKPKQIIICGSQVNTDDIIKCVHSFYIPNKALLVHDPHKLSFIVDYLPILKEMTMIDGKTTAYVCEDYKCAAPTNDVNVLRKMLDPKKTMAI